MNSIWWWFNSISSCRISTDENLEKVEKSFYVILSAIKQEGAINKEYKRIEFTNKVLLLVNNLECIEIPYEEFEFFSQIVLESIKSGKGTFEIPEIEPFLQKIKITKIKASNDSKKETKILSKLGLTICGRFNLIFCLKLATLFIESRGIMKFSSY